MAGIFAEDISVNNLNVKLINGGTYPPDIDGSNWDLCGNDIINKNSGNVGIGTDTPSEKLDVSGNISASGYVFSKSFYTGLTDDSIFHGLQIRQNTSLNAILIGQTQSQNSDDNGYNIRIDDGRVDINSNFNKDITFRTSNTELARIQNNGNVGIGTTNPSEKLMVAGRTVSLGIPILLGINNIDNLFSVTSTSGLPANSDIISVVITTVLTTGVSTNSKLLVRADGNCIFNDGVAGFTGNFDSSLKSSNSIIKFTSGSDNFIKTQFFSNGDTVSSQILPFNRVTTIQNTNTTTITTTITLNLGIGLNSQTQVKISIRDPIIEVWQIPF